MLYTVEFVGEFVARDPNQLLCLNSHAVFRQNSPNNRCVDALSWEILEPPLLLSHQCGFSTLFVDHTCDFK